ncbi:MAG: DnaJ domain-containing protein [Spirochaetales bacterium]|nr:DnaJ domain-containing protein [Spirochaetales bacterium]
MMIWGKLVGTVLGVFSGLGIYGAIVGLVLGHFVDMYLKQKKTKSLASVFYTRPESTVLPEREIFLMSAAALTASLGSGDEEKKEHTRELVGGILKVHLSLSMKETDAVQEYARRYLETAEADLQGLVKVYKETGFSREAHIALVTALLRMEERTGVLPEKTRFILSFSKQIDIPEEEFLTLRRHFQGVSQEHYDLLGLSTEATTEEIKRTYRNLAAFFHPDGASVLTEKQKEESEEAFLAIKKAYEAIMQERSGD